MFPGFVTAFKDNDSFIHLYFFPGLDDMGNKIYNAINLSNHSIQFDVYENTDGSIEYKFYDKNIKKIYCKLIHVKDNNLIENETLYID